MAASIGQAAMDSLTQPDLDVGKLTQEYDFQNKSLLQEGGYGMVYSINQRSTLAPYAYFLMDLADNGDLFDKVVNYGPLRVPCVQFYAAEVVSALEYLRSVNFVHRDIKAENILIDNNNHIKLSDFGSAKPIGHSQGTSLVQSVLEKNSKNNPGTKLFVAPEVWYQEPVSFGTDYWGLAFVIFLMYTATHIAEFSDRANASDYFSFFEDELWEYCFDNPDRELHDLVYFLLRRNPQERIGTVNLQDLKNHSFFSTIDWTSLANQRAVGFQKTREDDSGSCFAFRVKLLSKVTQPSQNHAPPAPVGAALMGAMGPSVSTPRFASSTPTPSAFFTPPTGPTTPTTPSLGADWSLSSSYLNTPSPWSDSGYQSAQASMTSFNTPQTPVTSLPTQSLPTQQTPRRYVSKLTVWLSDAWRQTTSPPPQPEALGTQGTTGQGAQGTPH